MHKLKPALFDLSLRLGNNAWSGSGGNFQGLTQDSAYRQTKLRQDLDTLPRLIWNSLCSLNLWFPCLGLPSAGITHVPYYIQLLPWFVCVCVCVFQDLCFHLEVISQIHQTMQLTHSLLLGKKLKFLDTPYSSYDFVLSHLWKPVAF